MISENKFIIFQIFIDSDCKFIDFKKLRREKKNFNSIKKTIILQLQAKKAILVPENRMKIKCVTYLK